MTRGDHALLCRRRYAVLRDGGFPASRAIALDRFTPSTRWLWLDGSHCFGNLLLLC